MLGAYILSEQFVNQIDKETKVNLGEQTITSMSGMIQNDSELYIGNDPSDPQI
jgi:hypothetical protein